MNDVCCTVMKKITQLLNLKFQLQRTVHCQACISVDSKQMCKTYCLNTGECHDVSSYQEKY
ncbi:hypothetical protein C0J52_08559 [Blattella germanica]|nr:hypothetical protein C0J52_08559 [Blattella germanica]